MNPDKLPQNRDAGKTSQVLPEILSLCATTWPTIDLSSFKECYKHVTDFFRGEHPHFKKNTLPYHNLRHTRIVTLATARIFHGLHHSGKSLRGIAVEKGLLCALFHDTGLLATRTDQFPLFETSDATPHEERSGQLMHAHANTIGLPAFFSSECEEIINHTSLDICPKDIKCSTESTLIGRVVGSADLLAQMADRYYLENLSSLFYEMECDKNTEFTSLEEMMLNTKNFYHNIQKRLENELGGVHHALTHHFLHHQQINKNIYLEQIANNINYLDVIIEKCYKKREKIDTFLRRKPPSLE